MSEAEPSAEELQGELKAKPTPAPEPGIHIPLDQLTDEALHAIVEECVTRDGTEHTEGDRKVAQVMALLERGAVEIWFNERTRTCSILPAGTAS